MYDIITLWWDTLTALERIFVAMAIPATFIMLLQSILLFVGIGFDGDGSFDTETDFDSPVSGTDAAEASDGLTLFTVRGIIAFFSIGGWAGLVASKSGVGPAFSSVVAIFAGGVALVGIAYLFKYALKLQESGNLDLKNAIGKTATVYIPIPENSNGRGKVTVLLQDRLVELSSVNKSPERINTGETVKITSLIDENTVVVERLHGFSTLIK